MIKFAKLLLLLLLLALFLVACGFAFPSEDEDLTEPEIVDAEEIDEADDDSASEAQSDEESEEAEDGEAEFTPPPLDSHVAQALTSHEMRRFEEEHAVSPEQERYLAFGAFVLANNRESIRVFALGDSGPHAARLLSEWWSVDDRESALEQLERLSSATGQSPIADEIYHTLVVNGYLDYVDGFILFLAGFDMTSMESLYNSSVNRAERMDDALDTLMELLELDEEDRDEAFELLVYMQFADRINRGLEAYLGARDMLINFLGFTEEELLSLPTLAAWDYGRVAIIARYAVEAGFLEEDEAWEYLKIAADSSAEIYTNWREYTAAHILGRALAFGNPSDDFRHTLNFLLHHPESSFQTIDFLGN